LQPKSDFTYNSSITMSLELPRFRLKDIGQIFAIRKRRISLGNTPNGRMLYEWFTQPHDKLPIVSNKTLGVELLDLQMFDDFEHYLKCINGKNSAAYYRRKALSKGYTFTDIDRNQYINDIYEINSSRETRQGRQMHPAYFEKPTQYIDEHNWLYCGVLNSSGKLVAYLNLQIANEVAVVRTLLGHGDFLNDGIMYLLLVEAARRIYELGGYRYLMYDMYFGSSAGLRLFKDKLGFRPYWVHWQTAQGTEKIAENNPPSARQDVTSR
jgi:hypothetical protein